MLVPHDESPLAVENPEIAEVLDLATGEILDARAVIGSDKERALRLRMALRQGIAEDKPLMACPLCTVPVHLVSMAHARRFYFRHETEDGRCTAKTKGALSERQILAMKYDGARESEAHRRMKEILAESLRGDPDFSDVEIEPTWKGAEANSRRRPDVRAVWRGTLPVAFEVQLSTTFLRVIAERRAFYLREGGLLLWVFRAFDHGDARLAHEDIFYNNNRNAFVASEDTLAASKAAKALVLDCVWSEPHAEDGRLLWSPMEARVPFRNLTLDREGQRVFLFDADAARARAEADLVDGPLREKFRRMWMAEKWDDAAWLRVRGGLATKGIRLPRYLSEADGLRPLLDSLYSASEGRPVGWGYADLVKVAHHVFDRHKGFLWAFKLMLAAHGRGSQIVSEDTTGKWRRVKVPAYLSAWKKGSPDFAPDRSFDTLVAFLFPEISRELGKNPRA